MVAEAKHKENATTAAEMTVAAQAVDRRSEQRSSTPSSLTRSGATIPPPSLDDTDDPRASVDAASAGAGLGPSDAQEGPPLSIRCKRSPAGPGRRSKLKIVYWFIC